MKLETFIDMDEFLSEVKQTIDATNLTQAMSTQTARAAFYSMQSIRAKRQKEEVAHKIKLITAQLTKVTRERLNEEALKNAQATQTKPERITVDMVQSEVALHPKMREWEQLQIEADEIYAVCKAAYDAFYTRREMLTSIGFLHREELRSNLTIRSAEENTNKYRERRAQREAERSGGQAQ